MAETDYTVLKKEIVQRNFEYLTSDVKQLKPDMIDEIKRVMQYCFEDGYRHGKDSGAQIVLDTLNKHQGEN